jgi:hypothetical protein
MYHVSVVVVVPYYVLFYCYVCSVPCIMCTVCVQMCALLLPPDVNPIAAKIIITIIILIIIIIIGKDTISFMQGIYAYIPETNHVPKQYNVAVILSLLFMVPISLAPALALMYFYISTFRSMCAVPNMPVFFEVP